MSIKSFFASNFFILGTTGIIVSAAAISSATVLIISKGSASHEVTKTGSVAGYKKWVDENQKDLDRQMITTAKTNKTLFSTTNAFTAGGTSINPAATSVNARVYGFFTSINELITAINLTPWNTGYIDLNTREYSTDIFKSTNTSGKKFSLGVDISTKNPNGQPWKNYDTITIDGKKYTYYKETVLPLNTPDFFNASDLNNINSPSTKPSTKPLPQDLYEWDKVYYSDKDVAYNAMFKEIDEVISDWGPVKKEQKTAQVDVSGVLYTISLKTGFKAQFTGFKDPGAGDFEVKASNLSDNITVQSVAKSPKTQAHQAGESFFYDVQIGDGTNPILATAEFEIPTFGDLPKWGADKKPLEDIYSKKDTNQVIYVDGKQYTYYGAGKDNPLFNAGVIPAEQKPFNNSAKTHSISIWEADATKANVVKQDYSFFSGNDDPAASFTQESGGRSYEVEYFGYATSGGALYVDPLTKTTVKTFKIDGEDYVYHESTDGVSFDQTTHVVANAGTNVYKNEVKLFDKSQNATVENNGYDYFPYWENTTTHDVYLTGFSFYNRVDIKDVNDTQFLQKTYSPSANVTANRKKISEMLPVYKTSANLNTFVMKNSALYRPATSANGNWYKGAAFDLIDATGKPKSNMTNIILTNPQIVALGKLYTSSKSDTEFTNVLELTNGQVEAKGYVKPVPATPGWRDQSGNELQEADIVKAKFYIPNLHAYFETKDKSKITPIFNLDTKKVAKNDLVSQGKRLINADATTGSANAAPEEYHYVDKYLGSPLPVDGLFQDSWDGTAQGAGMNAADGSQIRFDKSQHLFSVEKNNEKVYYTTEERMLKSEKIIKLDANTTAYRENTNKSAIGFIVEGYADMTDDERMIELSSIGVESVEDVTDAAQKLVEVQNPFGQGNVSYIYIDGKKYYSVNAEN